MRWLPVLLLFIWPYLAYPVFGQTGYVLDSIEVIASRVPLKVRETGRNISVVTSRQIADMPVNSIDEVLQSVPGLEVQSRGGFGVQGDILMRGSTFTQVLVLVDGMKMNDPLTGHFNSYIPVTLPEIERIEILRGAAAALYGADAVGGVINIITKTFSENSNPRSLGGSLQYGQHELVTGNMGFFTKEGKSAFGGGFSLNQSKGQPIGERVIDPSTTLEAYRTSFDLKTFGFSFSHAFSRKLSLHARTSYDYRDFDARYFYTSSALDKSVERVANWWNQVQLKHISNKGITDLNVAYKNNTDEFVFSPDFPSTNEHRTQFLNMTVNHLRELNAALTLMGGLQADRRMIESNDRGNHQDWHFGVYGMGVYRKNLLNLTVSLRGDYDENYQFEVSPQINMSIILEDLTIRGSVGRSIRAADYTERFVSNNLQELTPGRNLGNPDLLAETGWSEELGLDIRIIPGWWIKATGFARQSDNLIDYVMANEKEIGSVSETGSLQPNADYFFAQNIADVRTAGFEVESNILIPTGENSSLEWTAGYTYLNTTNQEGILSVYLSNHARHLVTTRFAARFGKFDFALNGIYKNRNIRLAPAIDSELLPDYFVCDLRTAFQFMNHLKVQLQVRNLFDLRYQNILGAPMPRRWVMAGFQWHFE